MEQDDPAEALTELRERKPSRLELLQVAAGSGLAAYAVWALLLQPGFRRVPLRLQRGRKREREIETSMMRITNQLPPTRPTQGIEPAIRACALTRNRTVTSKVHRLMLKCWVTLTGLYRLF
uniref:Uncharacterized protein n=1 Tax=Myotis myotis TaxID=51298 RepID=A0A7J7R7R8_MYOMY|nr:hypothetical protein mMyoMyo1_004834 [Myotis myotis]